ncbi:MAG: FAD/NAD(P)-binding oxidoreductase [Paracoccaceae bacterium]|nr:FAD/NAD(P)-binding oxidoreductase [Paracoccaceae bacterium]MDE2673774.1 FAD/NAD(P)-binding oxidoreductase [Paracoccaceae bacterium]
MERVVVVGGGQAGLSVVSKLRALDYSGKITMICGEPELPYQRPPLSKKYLTGEMEKTRLYLRQQSYYTENDIDLMLGIRCEEIDLNASCVKANGQSIPYDHLVLTTGSHPTKLPARLGGDLGGLYYIRDLADITALQPELEEDRKVLVVGGGFIGLETASALISKGLQVTIVEAAERIMQRVVAPETSAYFRNLHTSKGARLLEGVGLKQLEGNERVRKAVLSNDDELDVDFVIVGIGVQPGDTLAKEAGLDISNGIRVNAKGQTSHTNIWASGDCTSFPWQDTFIRLESVQNAIDQSETVAENIMGADKDYKFVPWFWTDQYEAKLQISGLGTGYTSIITRQGNLEDSVSFWYMRDDDLIAVDAINDPRSYMVGKRILEQEICVDPETLGNPDSDLKQLLRSKR